MKQLFIILISTIVLLVACKKEITVRTYGTDTIDNIVYQNVTWFYYGFSFSQAKLVSTESNPGPDIVLYLNKDDVSSRVTLQANNFLPSFFKIGEYANEDEAKKAFNDLKTVGVPNQWLGMADNIAPNQVWVYRSDKDRYTKIRIIKTEFEKLSETVTIGKSEFQWVHQPDGTVNFP